GCCPGGYWLLRGNGDGSFAARQPVYTRAGFAIDGSAAAVGLLDADALPDIAIVNNNGVPSDSMYTVHGNGDGTFAAPTHLGMGSYLVWLDIADVNGDGSNDVIAANKFGSGTPSVFLGDWTGVFDSRLDFGIDGSASFVRAADLNR